MERNLEEVHESAVAMCRQLDRSAPVGWTEARANRQALQAVGIVCSMSRKGRLLGQRALRALDPWTAIPSHLRGSVSNRHLLCLKPQATCPFLSRQCILFLVCVLAWLPSPEALPSGSMVA